MNTYKTTKNICIEVPYDRPLTLNVVSGVLALNAVVDLSDIYEGSLDQAEDKLGRYVKTLTTGDFKHHLVSAQIVNFDDDQSVEGNFLEFTFEFEFEYDYCVLGGESEVRISRNFNHKQMFYLASLETCDVTTEVDNAVHLDAEMATQHQANRFQKLAIIFVKN